jgi:CheY-like chemotaxis protein
MHLFAAAPSTYSLVTPMQVPLLNHCSSTLEVSAKPRRLLRKHILLVDDQGAVRETIHLLLNLDGHTVVEAANGVEALALFQQDHFDLVITDFEMPKMKGNELAAKIKQIVPSQSILMVTAYAEQLGASYNPVNAILDKPFQLKDLRLVIAELLS